jgi:hypothetical protein
MDLVILLIMGLGWCCWGVWSGSIVVALVTLFDYELPWTGRIALVAWVGVSLLLFLPGLEQFVSPFVPLLMQLSVLGWFAMRRLTG